MLKLALIALSFEVITFAIVWAISVKVRNYGFLDVAWSYGIFVLGPFYAIFAPGYGPRKWLLASLGALWSLRLGTYILIRVLRHHPEEDKRYETLRKSWPGPGMFLAFFEFQAVTVIFFSAPYLISSFNTAPALRPVEIAGTILSLVAIAGEALSDAQMQAFKRDPTSRGAVCQRGLWRYSRHPNYFFESLVWWAFFIFALGSPWGWATVLCPLLMLWFLFRVTGIPLTEQHAVRNKGDAYRDYQRTTSAFIPWFRKT
jgi:steroid 5-alpha reductase family enzyme